MAMGMHALDALLDLQRAVEAARKSSWFNGSTAGSGAFPPINVFRQGHDFVLVAELPGVDKDALDVQVKGRQVRIHGTKAVDFDEDASIHRRERRAGAFDRVLTVPSEIDSDRVKAEYHDGVLSVRLPRAEADRPRSISIN